jgi:hypothetical protein
VHLSCWSQAVWTSRASGFVHARIEPMAHNALQSTTRVVHGLAVAGLRLRKTRPSTPRRRSTPTVATPTADTADRRSRVGTDLLWASSPDGHGWHLNQKSILNSGSVSWSATIDKGWEAHCNRAFSIALHPRCSREFYSWLGSRGGWYDSDAEWIIPTRRRCGLTDEHQGREVTVFETKDRACLGRVLKRA